MPCIASIPSENWLRFAFFHLAAVPKGPFGKPQSPGSGYAKHIGRDAGGHSPPYFRCLLAVPTLPYAPPPITPCPGS